MTKTLFVLIPLLLVGSSYPDSSLLKAALQFLIDFPELQQYFHEDEFLERKPLVLVVSEEIPLSLELVKFDMPVTIIRQKEAIRSQFAAWLELKKLEFTADRVHAEMEYLAEGVVVNIVLRKREDGWVYEQATLREI